MRKRRLGRTDIEVSVMGLGTMTWGRQNDEREAWAQLDCATGLGINMIDTAEIYPFPVSTDLAGETERILGAWLSKRDRSKRDELVIASKVAGPSNFQLREHLPQSRLRLDRANILSACDGSLERLSCERIDIYYLHWPERNTNFMGQRGFAPDLAKDREAVSLEESLAAMKELIEVGKVRSVALSNETPWGVMESCRIADGLGIRDKLVAIQNPYSLLNRSFEVGGAEVCLREDIGLFPYSPLAGGVLSGKYLNGALPDKSRSKVYPQHTTRYRRNPNAEKAVTAYVALAQKHDLVAAQMALSFVTSRPFVCSNIMGATTIEQLEMNIAGAEISLSDELLAEIDSIEETYTSPCP